MNQKNLRVLLVVAISFCIGYAVGFAWVKPRSVTSTNSSAISLSHSVRTGNSERMKSSAAEQSSTIQIPWDKHSSAEARFQALRKVIAGTPTSELNELVLNGVDVPSIIQILLASGRPEKEVANWIIANARTWHPKEQGYVIQSIAKFSDPVEVLKSLDLRTIPTSRFKGRLKGLDSNLVGPVIMAALGDSPKAAFVLQELSQEKGLTHVLARLNSSIGKTEGQLQIGNLVAHIVRNNITHSEALKILEDVEDSTMRTLGSAKLDAYFKGVRR
jgi:hypothetical protein